MMISCRGTVFHCYQRPLDKGVIFYSDLDHLMYFTIYCIKAKQYHIVILKVVQMLDHLHHCIMEKSCGQLGLFLQNVSATFVKEYNKAYGRCGSLFEGPYGRAKKITEKSIRTNLLYLDNNPVERQLVNNAAEYRWDYLAFAVSDHPFSEKIVKRKASMKLRHALKMVEDNHNRGRYLTISMLKYLFKGLSDKEYAQLIDFIISTYSVIDYTLAGSYFKSYEDEIIAAAATTGKEYEINEHFLGKSDRHYKKMQDLLLKSGKVQDIHEVLSMTMESKRKLFSFLRNRMDVPARQVAALIHIPPDKV